MRSSLWIAARSDRTAEIAAKLGARVVESALGRLCTAKRTSRPIRAANDWILSIDADEALSEALEGEIWQIKKNGPRFDGYTMPRLAQYMGRWILHSGWYPDRKIRLYDRRKRAGSANSSMKAFTSTERLDISNPTCCISLAILYPNI